MTSFIELKPELKYTLDQVPLFIKQIEKALDSHALGLPRLRRHYHSAARRSSVYTGGDGLIFMQRYLHSLPLDTVEVPEFEQPNQSTVLDDLTGAHCGFLTTSVGGATLVAAQALKDPRHANAAEMAYVFAHIAHAVSEAKKVNIESDEGCEFMYGRAGLLYALLYLRKAALGDQTSAYVHQALEVASYDAISSVVRAILTHGRYGARMYNAATMTATPALMWSWHGKRYLGAAHGLAGILHVLLLCPESTLSTQDNLDVNDTVLWLVRTQEFSGNWPSSAAKRGNHLLQWCHGAPGVLIMLSTFLKRRRDLPRTELTTVMDAIRRGADLTYREGFLRKGVGLCHGVAGSVYALLAASDVLDTREDLIYFWKALHLSLAAVRYRELTEEGEMRSPDRPWSLFEGLAGMCCAWGAILTRLHALNAGDDVAPRGGMPAFDNLS